MCVSVCACVWGVAGENSERAKECQGGDKRCMRLLAARIRFGNIPFIDFRAVSAISLEM